MNRALLGRRLESPLIKETVYEAEWTAGDPELLADHRVYDAVAVAGTAFVEVALAGAAETFGPGDYVVEDFEIREALVLDEVDSRTVQLILRKDEGDRFAFEIHSKESREADAAWNLHAGGKVRAAQPGAGSQWSSTLDEARLQCREELSPSAYYDRLRDRGLDYGPGFANIEQLWRGEGGQALGVVVTPRATDLTSYVFHPGVLDSCFQVVGASAVEMFQKAGDAYLITGFERLSTFGDIDSTLWCHGFLRPGENAQSLYADLHIYNERGRRVAEVEGIAFKRVASKSFERMARKKKRENLQYTMGWVPAQLSDEASSRVSSERWLIVSDGRGVGSRLKDELQNRGALAVLATPREPIEATRRAVIGFLQADTTSPSNVVYLGSLDSTFDPAAASDALDAGQRTGCGGLLSVTQAVIESRVPNMPRLWVITERAQPVKPGESLAVDRSTVLGLIRVIRIEHPELRCVSVDLDTGDAKAQAETVVRELGSADAEDQVALRAGTRYAARLQSVPPDSAAGSTGEVRADATYLITGGLGGLGLRVAEWMVRQGARSLVLLGRSSPSASASKTIAEMENRGAHVAVRQCDVSRAEDISRVFSEISASMPALRGIVHAAGVLDDGVVVMQTWERFAKVLAPKVQGTWNLHQYSQDAALDFFVMFSSAVSVLGAAGQSNYAAGNAFLDAVAHHRQSLGLPGVSINWPPWADTGMAAKPTAIVEGRWKARGAGSIRPAQALEIMQAIMQGDRPQVAVLPIQWPQYVEHLPAGRETPFFADVLREAESSGNAARSQRGPDLKTRLQAAPPNNAREVVFEYVREQVLRVLGLGKHDAINEQQPLNELGLDSLMAVELKNALGASVGRSLSAGLLFLYPSVHALSEYISTEILQLPARTRNLSEVEAAPAAQTVLLDEIEHLSEDELDEKLAALLDQHLVANPQERKS